MAVHVAIRIVVGAVTAGVFITAGALGGAVAVRVTAVHEPVVIVVQPVCAAGFRGRTVLAALAIRVTTVDGEIFVIVQFVRALSFPGDILTVGLFKTVTIGAVNQAIVVVVCFVGTVLHNHPAT
jgi:hypothetical protein